MRENDKYYTDLDSQLQEIALVNWADFVKLVGEEALINAKICMLRARGYSLGQIANKFSITKRTVQIRSGNCSCNKS